MLAVLGFEESRLKENHRWLNFSRAKVTYDSHGQKPHAQHETNEWKSTGDNLLDACTEDGTFRFSLDANASWPAPHHFLDRGIANTIPQLVGNASLLDLGAGSGQYGAHFHELKSFGFTDPHNLKGVPRYAGVEGVPNVEAYTRRFGPPGALVTYANICEPGLHLGVYDWVMSFEVGEHLPNSCLADYLQLIDRSNKYGTLLAWSGHVSGMCHINPRTYHTIICAFKLFGYELNEWQTRHARGRAHIPWMRHDYLVLNKARDEGVCGA